ncbi:hypothetical protein H7E67_01325 [Clostridium gasigenes]|uniref:hypothetical protein n=1 Tax=Clostridium gasigenes TaxID=94869 RepID=UPI00162A82E0|nr:hypothetical protein [Clostridium gasigenes]MBB6622060.1 hypothetical protein [Clostridium gasigenes]
MKMNIEFNSNEELLTFIRTFGGAPLTTITPQVTSSEAMMGIITEVKETKPTTIPTKETKPVVDKVVTPVVPTVDAEIVKVETETTEPVQEVEKTEKVITMVDVRAVFSKLIKAGKQADAKKITLEFGANKLTELKEEHYAAAIEKAEALL